VISFYFTVPFLLFLAMLETTLSPYVRPLGVHPDLVTLAVLSWSLLRGTREGAVWAVIGGMGLDLLSAGPFGISALALLPVSLLTGLDEGRFFRGHALLLVLSVTVATVTFHTLLLLLLQVLGYPVNWGYAMFRVVAPLLLVNGFAMPILYGFLLWVHRRSAPQGFLP